MVDHSKRTPKPPPDKSWVRTKTVRGDGKESGPRPVPDGRAQHDRKDEQP